MELGASFPSREIGNDPGAIRAYAQGAEALGYSHIAIYDHVLGADTVTRPNWDHANFPYTIADAFHEPFTLFSFLAGCTARVILEAAVIVLPQRQTALVAKQAAEVDVLSRGRMRMGAGIGRFWLEFESLGANFKDRTPRMEEQMAVLRALWTQQVVHIEGKWHKIIDQGINPLPVQRPIPIWLGGGRTDSALRRIARLGDGWTLSPLTTSVPDQQAEDDIANFRRYLAGNGRPAAGFPIEVPFNPVNVAQDQWAPAYDKWAALDVSHILVRTEGNGFTGADQHLDLLRRYRDSVKQG